MAQNSLVTVGVALYNHEQFIVECLRSIVDQTWPSIELIVIDDGSTDLSYQVAKDYLESQTRLHNYSITSRANVGMCNTLNEIAHAATGEYISFIGSDDFWMIDKIEDQAHYLDEHPDITLVHSNSMKVDGQGKELKLIDYSGKDNSGILFEALVKRTGGINTPSHLYRSSVYQNIGYYDPAFSFEDTDFWLRLTREHQVGYINKTHTGYRWHGRNLSDRSNALNFYHSQLIAIYKKNIKDVKLLKIAVSRIYRKSFFMALRQGRFGRGNECVQKLFLYVTISMKKTSLDHLYQKNADYYGGHRSEMLRYLPARIGSVLDIGCGQGQFAKTIKEVHGAEAWGVDINERSIEAASQVLDKAICGDAADLMGQFPDRHFDVVYCNDVLEHMVDPYTFLAKVKSKLSVDGCMISSIPNIRYFRVLYQLIFRKDFKYESAGVMDSTHLRFFTAKSMARMFAEAGYQIDIIEPINKSKSIKPIVMQLLSLGTIGSDIYYPQFGVRAIPLPEKTIVTKQADGVLS